MFYTNLVIAFRVSIIDNNIYVWSLRLADERVLAENRFMIVMIDMIGNFRRIIIFKVSDIDAALERIKEVCPNVVYVSLLGNPGYPDQLTDHTTSDEADYERYRLYAIHALPTSLRFLDSRPVTRQERIDARNRGRLLRTVKLAPRKMIELSQHGFDEIDVILDVNYTPLPQSRRSPTDHKGKYAKLKSIKNRGKGSTLYKYILKMILITRNLFLYFLLFSGAYGKCRYRYSGKNSEGNRFISNNDL